MTKRLRVKYKIDRRLGVNLWGREKSPINKREYGPGEHGQGRKKKSDYGIQLYAKQKIKGYYGNITEKQFHKIYKEADRKKGDTGENLVQLLERRLDTIIYRMKFAPTVFSSRQLINHGHVLVNNKRLNIPSATIRNGDVIEIKESSKKNIAIIESTKLEERDIPNYLEVDLKEMKGSIISNPILSEIPYPVKMEPNQVIEFYSR
jgi:small subunit ribosomal protein S4